MTTNEATDTLIECADALVNHYWLIDSVVDQHDEDQGAVEVWNLITKIRECLKITGAPSNH